MNRRDVLRGIAGVTAAGIVLPGEEVVRRFWRGWSPAEASGRNVVVLDGMDYPITGPEWEVRYLPPRVVYSDYVFYYPQLFGDGTLVYWDRNGPCRVERPD